MHVPESILCEILPLLPLDVSQIMSHVAFLGYLRLCETWKTDHELGGVCQTHLTGPASFFSLIYLRHYLFLYIAIQSKLNFSLALFHPFWHGELRLKLRDADR